MAVRRQHGRHRFNRPHRYDAGTGDKLASGMRRNSGPADRDAAFPTTDLERLRDTGCLSAPLSVSLGGLGLGTEPAGSEGVSKLLRLLGRGNLSVALPL